MAPVFKWLLGLPLFGVALICLAIIAAGYGMGRLVLIVMDILSEWA